MESERTLCVSNKLNLKRSRKEVLDKPQGADAFQTPPHAVVPLLHYLDKNWTIWEPACGAGLLSSFLASNGFRVIETDLIYGENFFAFEPDHFDCIVTNPPYSIKFHWLKRCYKLGKPFALLLPVEVLGARSAQLLFTQHGLEVILLDRRVNFVRFDDVPVSSAWFPVAWFTWQLGIGRQLTFAKLPKEDSFKQVLAKGRQPALFDVLE